METYINLGSVFYDKGDYENAKKILSRLLSLIEIMPSDVYNQILTEELYSVCTFDFNEKRADELMYELEKYLNNKNNVGSVRAKLSYLVYILKVYVNSFQNLRQSTFANSCWQMYFFGLVY